jgi:hypothetical protein
LLWGFATEHRRIGKKAFFFEKKNQKTFAPALAGESATASQKFLLLFSKRSLSSTAAFSPTQAA